MATEGDVEEEKGRLGGGDGFLGCGDVAFAGAYGELGVNGHGALNDSGRYGPKFVVLDTSGHPADFTIAQQHRIAVNGETVFAAVEM